MVRREIDIEPKRPLGCNAVVRRSLLQIAGHVWGRIVPTVLLVSLLGCAARDPLDREVEAYNLAELRAWIADVHEDVDPELGKEIDLVFTNLASQTPRFRKPTTEREMLQRGNPLCQRVNGRRLRDVMIDSYSAAIMALTQQNNIDAENLLRLSSVVNTDRAEAFAEHIEFVQAEIAKRDERIRLHRERIASLKKEE